MEQRHTPARSEERAGLSRLLEAFPHFRALEPEASRLILQVGRIVSVPDGQAVFRDGDPAPAFMFVLDGAVRVQKVAETGREIVLYRVEKGETCVMTTSCLISCGLYAAEGVTEGDVTALVLPAASFRTLLSTSESFRNLIFQAHAARIADLFMLIEEVVFGRIDLRLAGLLVRRAEAGRVKATHSEIAAELGTSREVISRQLKEFERRGWLSLHRGSIALRDVEALAHHS